MKLNAHVWSDGAMAELIKKLLMCDNYSYVFLSTINCMTLGTVVTLFLFIQRSVPISSFIYLPQNPYFYLFI